MAASNSPKVLILGAGLGGLTLAQALRKKNIPFEIYERDAGLYARFQGWAIALHFIVADLRESLPDDLPPIEVTSHLLPIEDRKAEFTIFFGDGKHQTYGATDNGDLIRANRTRLREYLSMHLNIYWDTHTERIEENGDKVTLHFKGGASATGDILVGADGIHSKVRTHLIGDPHPLNTLPMGMVVGETTLTEEQYLRQMNLSNSAYAGISRDGKHRIFVGLKPVAQDRKTAAYYWMLNWRDPEAHNEPYWTHSASQQKMYDFAREGSKVFDDRITEIIRLTKPEGMMAPPIIIRDMLPPQLPNKRIVLLGDAIHPMTPFRGEGGNNAMLDSLKLARAIASSEGDDLLANLKAYQDEVHMRGTDAVQHSRNATEDDGSETAEAWGNRKGN